MEKAAHQEHLTLTKKHSKTIGKKHLGKNMNQYKTILAPNAPWPKMEPKVEPKRQKKAPTLDKFLNENRSKIAITSRKRDKLSGRLLPNDWVA